MVRGFKIHIQKLIRNRTSNQLVVFYRYLSTIAISLFYFIYTKDKAMLKYGIPMLICISSAMLNYLYSNNRDNKNYMAVLIMIESIISAIIIYCTGGSSSPFIWYTFNSLLIGLIINDQIIFPIICFSIYLFSIISSNIIRNDHTFSFNANIILCFIMITGLIYIIYKCVHDIQTKNIELETANIKISETMDHIMELYNTMHIFTVTNDQDDIIKTSLGYISAITNSANSGFLTFSDKKINYHIMNGQLNHKIDEYIHNNLSEISKTSKIIKYKIDNHLYFLCPIVKNMNFFGVLVFEVEKAGDEIINDIIYICELTAITLEKLQLEKINSDLLINSEQNRIATEIHDNVLQSLFSMTCFIYTLIKKKSIDTVNEITIEHLNTIRNAIVNSIADLRNIIYSLSLYKDGTNLFIEDIKNKIREIMDYSEIHIELEVEADTERLSYIQKKSLYKIICELLYNSAKHSYAEMVKIEIYIVESNLICKFQDDGIGFDYKKAMLNNKLGLGLKNIHYLIEVLHGDYTINSSDSQGTVFVTSIPL